MELVQVSVLSIRNRKINQTNVSACTGEEGVKVELTRAISNPHKVLELVQRFIIFIRENIDFQSRNEKATLMTKGKVLRQLSRKRASYIQITLTDKARDKTKGEGVNVPKGYVPVAVGTEEKDEAKFLIHVDVFKNDCFVGFLEMVATVVGYQSSGILRIPCHTQCFTDILDKISRIHNT
ncbi:hypothetical protein GQ457_01G040880 [Hibiscus cannabinus]